MNWISDDFFISNKSACTLKMAVNNLCRSIEADLPDLYHMFSMTAGDAVSNLFKLQKRK